jgi:hypothetical protein
MFCASIYLAVNYSLVYDTIEVWLFVPSVKWVSPLSMLVVGLDGVVIDYY